MVEKLAVDGQKSEILENCNNVSETVTSEPIVEKTEDNIQTVIRNDEIDVNNESDWQKPISLKGFKKKLNEIFVVKCVENLQ